MPTITITDNTKILNEAREAEKLAHLTMLAAFAQLQLDVNATHNVNWDVVSVRRLEDKIDKFKESCQAFCKAKDAIIKAMSLGGDRFDSSVPSPQELWSNKGIVPPGWRSEVQDGIPVLVPDADPPTRSE